MRTAAISVVPVLLRRLILTLALAACFTAASSTAHAAPATPTRGIFAEGSGDRLWVAQVVAGDGLSPAPQPATERTRVYSVLVMGNDGGWQRPTLIGAGVKDLAHRGTQLVALLKTGEWMFVWPEGKSIGPALPADGDVVTLGSDGTTVYAVGAVPGGIDAVPAPPTTAPTTQDAARGGPTTRPAAADTAATTAPASLPAELVLFRLDRSTWIAETELPAEIPPDVRTLSMTLVRGKVFVSAVLDGQVAVFERATDTAWTPVARLKPESLSVTHAKLLDGGDRPIVWAAAATGAGVFYFTDGHHPVKFGKPVELRVQHDLSQPLHRDVTVVAQRLRLIFAKNDKLFSQTFDWRTGQPVRELTTITPATGMTDSRTGFWMNAAIMGVLILVMLGAMRRRGEIEETVRRLERIPLASIGLRFGAAIVDLWPYFAAGLYLSLRQGAPADMQTLSADPNLVPLSMIAMGTYIAHTMLFEILFNASIGKLLFGLRVVQLNGERPTTGALFVRNLLRAVDLSLFFVGAVMILMSPLRQRLGDLAAGTIVIRRTGQADAIAKDEETEAPVGTAGKE